jgi:hypothetical protein
MSWNGHIPVSNGGVEKGVRNKRNKKSFKAIAAKLARSQKRAKNMKFAKKFGNGPSDYGE